MAPNEKLYISLHYINVAAALLVSHTPRAWAGACGDDEGLNLANGKGYEPVISVI